MHTRKFDDVKVNRPGTCGGGKKNRKGVFSEKGAYNLLVSLKGWWDSHPRKKRKLGGYLAEPQETSIGHKTEAAPRGKGCRVC